MGNNEYQLCPKCNGQGTICMPEHIPGDVDHFISSELVSVCHVCKGEKIIVTPCYENRLLNEIELLKEENNTLRMENMTHEYNQAEALKFAPEFERQIREDERAKVLSEIY